MFCIYVSEHGEGRERYNERYAITVKKVYFDERNREYSLHSCVEIYSLT